MSYEEHCLYRNFEGVAVICADFFSRQIQALLEKDLPCVTVDYTGDRHASVMTDTQAAYNEMADYVYQNGHRRIAVIRDDSTVIAETRYQCLRRAFDARGLELADGRTFACTFNHVDAAAEATDQILSLARVPTCIFYPDDIACMGGINALKQRGYSVPRDISVVGFDGIQLSQVIQPHLTTYRQDMETIGLTALQLLLSTIDNPKGDKPHRLIPGQMLPGETVARV
jgi:LacI family transcriptional regulator